jgi:hypothetical protein
MQKFSYRASDGKFIMTFDMPKKIQEKERKKNSAFYKRRKLMVPVKVCINLFVNFLNNQIIYIEILKKKKKLVKHFRGETGRLKVNYYV